MDLYNVWCTVLCTFLIFDDGTGEVIWFSPIVKITTRVNVYDVRLKFSFRYKCRV
jgi:hypothetical protein